MSASQTGKDLSERRGRRPRRVQIDPATLATEIGRAAVDHKAVDVEIIDVRGKVDYADFVVIMSGRSDRQVAALARNLEAALKQKGHACLGVEGLPHAAWLLMDYGDVIVHIFHHDMRGYYDLETLWIDAPRLQLDVPDNG